MKEKGFTLVELLAVIVILAIIALIAVPIVLNIIKDTEEKANIESAKMYLKAVTLAIENKNLEGHFNPTECEIKSNGNIKCGEEPEIVIDVENAKSKATGGTIELRNWDIISVSGLKINNSIYDYSDGKFELLHKYTIKFNMDGADSQQEPNQEILTHRKVQEPSNPTKEGYIFKGWQLDGHNYDFDTPVTKNMTLKAKWVIQTTYILTSGQNINGRIKTLARGSSSDYSTKDTTVKTISFYSNGNLPEGYTLEQLKALSVNGEPKDLSSDNKKTIMAYWDGNGNIYVYSEGQITMNSSTGYSSSGVQHFWQFNGVTAIDLSQVDTSNATSMSGMFASCSSLTSLDLSNFNTSNVTSMSNMFLGCSNLISITFSSNFNTSNVTNMESMFASCSSLTSLDLSVFNTPSLTVTRTMFPNCSSLTSLDLRNAELGGVTSFGGMFTNVPKSVPIYLKDTQTNRDFMSTNFSSYTNVQYIAPTEEESN